jgi:hypothetical protein
LRAEYKERFYNPDYIHEIDSDDSWVRSVLYEYITYFRSVLTGISALEAEKELITGLTGLLTCKSNNLDEIEDELKKRFVEKGYSFLGGITPPYRGPYIWKTTSRKEFSVILPEDEQKMTVYFVSDFLMLSWAHFATLGERHTGGWAAADGLYYVNNSDREIDTESVNFQVWFLKHEAQHLSDYRKYPGLKPVNLEYRAKLIELIYNPDSVSLMEKFINEAKNDVTLPHSFAAYSIIKGLSPVLFNEEYINTAGRWKSIRTKDISEAALKLFSINTEKLNNTVNYNEYPYII